ncbi:Retrovirus-related Pol polyprotein from transposon RE2 [Vitis vinifera]|uniref:Retrovirus-related Pol polyprotein from transposon RE2 n=1 Tax=Vitis vinifera TaxID=29760 RepID=A0A438D1C3_VITVI|nr:Retrovirus-related Pol polyprotein from transposon RE2 [Vitis vinifera]
MADSPSLPLSPSVIAADSTPLALNIDVPQSFTTDNDSLFGNVMCFSSLVKLDWNNFLLWKSVIVPTVKGHDLDGYLFGTQPIPEKMISTMEKYGETKFILNPVYVKWVRTDQRLLCWLLSSISESVLPKVVGPTHETWKTLEMVIVGYLITNDDLMLHVLVGFGSEYDPVVVNLTSIIELATCGATSHVTTELENLSMKSDYHGKDKVAVDNGKKLFIAHVGHTEIPSLSSKYNIVGNKWVFKLKINPNRSVKRYNARPDISYSMDKLSQFMKNPTMVDWQAVKRVLWYLKGSVDCGIHLKLSKILGLTTFSDVDWGSCPHDQKSVSGYCVYFAVELTWLQSLLKELRIALSTCPLIWCDNMSVGSLAANPIGHARTKHLEIDLHFVRDKVAQ